MTPSAKELLWLSCAAKRCCTLRTVKLTGADIWRIATTLQVPPASFVRAVPAEDDTGFALDTTTRRWHAALARNSRKDRATPCIFLMQLGDTARCSLGELRPLSCQLFPTTETHGLICIQDQSFCACRSWSLGDLDLSYERQLLEQEAAEQQRYAAVIRDWNALVAQAKTGSQFTLSHFGDHLLAAYESFHAAEQRGAV